MKKCILWVDLATKNKVLWGLVVDFLDNLGENLSIFGDNQAISI